MSGTNLQFAVLVKCMFHTAKPGDKSLRAFFVWRWPYHANQTNHRKITSVIARPKAVVTEGNACGAISWKNPGNRTKYQEIATSGYALLAMTW